jgi:tetratricopeptide (TPR) repeat protein
MSEGLKSIEDGRWEEARSALELAARLSPGAPEVADALARAAAGQRREEIAARIQQTLALEKSETWHEAEKTFRAVLAVDPEAAAALEGHERASYRADLDDKLDYHLRNPGRLTSPVVLEDASTLLEEAWGVRPAGPRLAEQMKRLEQLIETASTPVPVVLESDNLTEIMVHRVGRLGTFSRHELSLRPGTYTAVGSRAGFRDVRVRFAVAPGTPQKPVVIRCTDAI